MIYENEELENNLDTIFIEPPNTAVEKDKDSEDDKDMTIVNNPTGRQLQVGAEIKLRNNERIGNNDDDGNDVLITESEPSTSKVIQKHPPTSKETKPLEISWINNRLTEAEAKRKLKQKIARHKKKGIVQKTDKNIPDKWIKRKFSKERKILLLLTTVNSKVYLKHIVSKIAGGVHMVGYPTWAICLPSNCTDEDSLQVMSMSQPLGIGVGSITCQTIDDVYPPLNTDAIIGISILSFLLLLVIASTIYDVYCQNAKRETRHPVYIAFSVYTNGQKLFQVSKRSSPLSCLDGIKVISMVWVIILHTYSVYTSGPVFNSKDVINLTNSLLSMVFINGDLACDSFLIVGGTLVTYVFFKKEKENEISLSSMVKHYFHRYIRLTPPLAGVVLVSATLIKYMGSGPKWTYIVKYFQGFCLSYWWSSLLYIQNEVNVDQMCAGHTWYLDVDMQLYILSPLIFWMLRKHTKTGISLLVVGIIASIVTAFFRAFDDQLSGISSNYYAKTPSTVYMNDYYLKTETRASPWLIGTILGYMLTRQQFTDIRVSKKIVIPMWILSIAVMLLCVLGGHSTLRGPEYYRLQNAFYIALLRPSFALAVGWVIWACATKHGGIINTFLSLSVFQFLNKFIYSMYLLHVTSLYMIIFSQKTSVYITVFNLAYWFWGIFMFMFGLSIIWVLIFESPMMNLEKIILKKIDSTSKQPPKERIVV